MTCIHFMLFILRIKCFKPVFAFFWWALRVIFPHKAISGSTGVAHGCCWRTWQLYVHASFTALSSSFFQAISVFFTARLKMPSFFSPPLSHIISTCQAKGSRQMDGQLNTQIFRGAKETMERWNEGVTACDSSRLSNRESGRKERERIKVRIEQGGPIFKLLTYLGMTYSNPC